MNIIIDEKTLQKIVNKIIKEEQTEEKKPTCVPENIIPLDMIVGPSNEYQTYANGIKRRKQGLNSIIDTLALLNNLRLLDVIEDGGEHLAYDLMQQLNHFRNKNYYDETSNQCSKAMDKIIELYKESEHGTELVKDIEKILALQSKDDEYTPSPRTKEYLKRCIVLAKGE